jgi:hypothetical protein
MLANQLIGVRAWAGYTLWKRRQIRSRALTALNRCRNLAWLRKGDYFSHSDCGLIARNQHVDTTIRLNPNEKLFLSTVEAGQYGLRHDTLPQLASGSCHLEELQWNSHSDT